MARQKRENRLHIGLQRPVIEEHAKVVHALVSEHLGNHTGVHRIPRSPEELHVTVLHIDQSPNIIPGNKSDLSNNLPPSALNRITTKLGKAAIFGSPRRWFAAFELDSKGLLDEVKLIDKLATKQREKQGTPDKTIALHKLYPHLTVGICLGSAVKPDVELFKEAFDKVRQGVSRELDGEITLEPVHPTNRQVRLVASRALRSLPKPDHYPAKQPPIVQTVRLGSIPLDFINSIKKT